MLFDVLSAKHATEAGHGEAKALEEIQEKKYRLERQGLKVCGGENLFVQRQ